MSREQKIAKARELRAAGLTYDAIARRLGMSHPCIWGWCNPEAKRAKDKRSNAKRGPAKRAWEDAQRANCEDCGRTLQGGSALPCRRNSGKCLDCWWVAQAAELEPRYKQIEAWWAEGLTYPEICAHLGWSENHLGVEIHRMRAAGRNLPYRYKTGKRAGRRFPDQVAA